MITTSVVTYYFILAKNYAIDVDVSNKDSTSYLYVARTPCIHEFILIQCMNV